MNGEVRRVALTRVVASRWQPRDAAFDPERLWELACSIKEQDLINAIVVFPVQVAEDDPEPWYELVAGERRTRAVLGLAWAGVDEVKPKEAVGRLAAEGLGAVPDEVRGLLEAAQAEIVARVEPAEDLARLHRMAVVENIERESLSPIEEARALQGLVEAYGWRQRELARHIGKSQSYVAQRLGLLGLTETAQAAVSARVLTATHARAIARVPAALQPAVTAWAVEALGDEDTPATTRRVQTVAREVARFVDPLRWQPNEDHVYRPEERNWLALMAWAVGKADLEDEEVGERVLALRAVSPADTNWLGKKPLGLVKSPYGRLRAVRALGVEGKPWEVFARETGRRMCEQCVFAYSREEELAQAAAVMDQGGHCRWWRNQKAETCEGFIGEGDPVVIPLDYSTSGYLSELEIPYEGGDEGGEFEYMTAVDRYVVAYRRAAALKAKQAAERQARGARQHIVDIQAFQEWQLEQPDGVLHHFQAHGCAKCGHYRPELIEEGLPACEFAVKGLTHQVRGGQGDQRAPEFGALVTREGVMLPRCEQFAYREVPKLARVTAAEFERNRALRWMEWLGRSGGSYGDHHAVWGILRWLNYGRPVEAANDWERLKRFVRDQWEEIGGDEAVATLLDVALSERRARGTREGLLRLVNGVTGEEEEFMGVDFRYVAGKDEMPRWMQRDWPEGWVRPWEDADRNTDHRTGTDGDG